MPDYRLAAFDLDGTLLNGPAQMSDANAVALRELVELGVVVAPATARFHQAAVRPFAAAGLEVAAVSSAGADVRAADGTVIEQRTIDLAAARHLMELSDRADWKATVATAGLNYRRDPVPPAWAADPPPYLRAVSAFAGTDIEPVLAVLFYASPDDPWLAGLTEVAAYLNVHAARTHDGVELVTVTAAGVDKGTGLRALCEAFGVGVHEAVVFGDSDVDLPMFDIAGHAVVMASAPEAIRIRGHRLAPAGGEGVAAAVREISGWAAAPPARR